MKLKTDHSTLSRNIIIKKLLVKHAEKIRFGIVGSFNTGIDFVILFILSAIGFDKIIANFFSTSTAFIFSFFANKKFTFKNTKTSKKQFLYFLVITLTGLWLIQPIIMEITEILLIDAISSAPLLLLIGKLFATIITLVWNYILYKKIVFTTSL